MHFIRIKHVFILLSLILAALVADIVIRYQHNANERAAGDHHASAAKQLWHCGMHPQVIQDHPGECPICHMALTPLNSGAPASGGTRKMADGPDVWIDPAIVQNMGVRTAKVTRGPLGKTVRTVGVLKLPEPGLHDVALKVNGWIDVLHADQVGMHVVKGEPLFELYSQELQVAEQELISAVQSEKSLEKGADPALRQEAQNLIDSVKRKLRLWDVSEEDIDAIARARQPPKTVPFRSPASGHLEEKMIVQGSAVQAGMKLMRIADHATMWLDAQVYQEQLPVVKIGQRVVAAVDGIPGKTFTGTISFMQPHLDHVTRTLTVRVMLDNPGFELKPGMYATAEIHTEPIAGALQAPREAVIDTGTRQIVFVAEAEGHFSPRKVRMGMLGDDDKAQILEGLAAGETVVTSGQFLMDVESRTIEATQKLTAAPAPDAESAPPPTENRPASAQAAGTVHELTVAYCPMAKANWLQSGDAIANPYMGSKMLACGSVTKRLPIPPAYSALATVVRRYLDVAGSLDADTLNSASVEALLDATSQLADEHYNALKSATSEFTAAKNIEAARRSFQPLSAQLISALEQPTK